MKLISVPFLALLGLATAAIDTLNPVARITKMLGTLQESIEQDGKAEQLLYDKYACWCENTSKQKARSIIAGEDGIRDLGQRILKLKGKVATLTSEIKDLKTKIRDIEDEQDEATNLRQNENGAYMSESATTKQALAALEKAIGKLAAMATKSEGVSLLQEAQGVQGRNTVAALLEALPSYLPPLASQHVAFLSEFAKGRSGYAPQSATISGMLGDMYSTFSAELETETSTEAGSNAKYERLLATLEEEKNELESTRDRKSQDNAEAEAMLADATKAYDDTDNQMQADIAFFDSLKVACKSKHKEWTVRKKMRDQELLGIKKALEILTSDESRVLFDKSIKPGLSFMQADSTLLSNTAARAYQVVQQQVRKTRNVRLAALAVSIRIVKAGHFGEVIKAIDKMMNTLKEEAQADRDKKSQCVESYQQSSRDVSQLDWQIKNNLAKIAKFDNLLETRTREKANTIEKMRETREYINEATAERKAEHEEFQKAKKDDETAINVLTSARHAMEKYYKENGIEMGPIEGSVKLLQENEPVFDRGDNAPGAKLTHKGSRKGEAKGILSMFAYIIEDMQAEILEGKRAETKSQWEYEGEMETAERLYDDLKEQKTTLEGIIAKRLEQKEEENKDMKENDEDRDAELAYKAKIKPDCDWILKAFDQRANARDAELDGLASAKELLSGRQALLQTTGGKVHGRKSPGIGFLHAH